MINYQEIFKEHPLSHHAYGIETPAPLDKDFLAMFKSDNYSYIYHKCYDSFKIGDTREIKSLQNEKTDKSSLFILEFSLINDLAQNALLKIFEEPSTDTHFILAFPLQRNILPTLQSRMHILKINTRLGHSDILAAKDFISKSLQERFVHIKEITDVKGAEPITKTDVINFLNHLELDLSKGNQYKKEIFCDIFRAREYINSNGASMKMILDGLAMSLEMYKK